MRLNPRRVFNSTEFGESIKYLPYLIRLMVIVRFGLLSCIFMQNISHHGQLKITINQTPN